MFVLTKGHYTEISTQMMPLIEDPGRRVAVDVVGPVHPASESGRRYILTLVDYATRYSEAAALKSISTVAVAGARSSTCTAV